MCVEEEEEVEDDRLTLPCRGSYSARQGATQCEAPQAALAVDRVETTATDPLESPNGALRELDLTPVPGTIRGRRVAPVHATVLVLLPLTQHTEPPPLLSTCPCPFSSSPSLLVLHPPSLLSALDARVSVLFALHLSFLLFVAVASLTRFGCFLPVVAFALLSSPPNTPFNTLLT